MDVSAIVKSAQFHVVQHMTTEQLQNYLDNDENVNTMVDDHDLVKEKKQQKEMVITESQTLSAFNLSNESRLKEERQKLLSLHVENRQARENYERNKRQLDQLAGKYSLAAAKKELENSATKKEEDAEDLADNFMDGEMTVDEFLQSFQTCRLDAHLKRIKADKMHELVNKLPNYQNWTPLNPRVTPQGRRPVIPPREPQRVAQPTPTYHHPVQPPPMSYDKPIPAPRGGVPVYSPGMPQFQPANGGIQYY